jgi:hypothetical protein
MPMPVSVTAMTRLALPPCHLVILKTGPHHNLPRVGKLGGVTEQIEQDLAQFVLVGVQ